MRQKRVGNHSISFYFRNAENGRICHQQIPICSPVRRTVAAVPSGPPIPTNGKRRGLNASGVKTPTIPTPLRAHVWQIRIVRIFGRYCSPVVPEVAAVVGLKGRPAQYFVRASEILRRVVALRCFPVFAAAIRSRCCCGISLRQIRCAIVLRFL